MANKKNHRICDIDKDREIILENGWKGVRTIAGQETEDLSFGYMVVGDRKFFCSKNDRKKLEKYLNGINDNEIDVTVLDSMAIQLDKTDGRRKKKSPPKENKKPESVTYNCTVRVPKQYVLPMLDEMAEHIDRIVEILVEMVLKEHEKEQEKPAKNEMSTRMPWT